jgi:methylated-DNA-protein-cysteine methyltransferase related protein
MKKQELTKNRFDLIYDLVRMIPEGRVASYGQIAHCSDRCTPRMVGFAMAAVPHDSDIPWHRVINSKGMISLRSGGDGASIQRVLLEAEGIWFDNKGRVDLAEFGWEGINNSG